MTRNPFKKELFKRSKAWT